MQLPQALIAQCDQLIAFGSIDSTMEEARRRFDPGSVSRVWIVAGEQLQGRGRLGRAWISPPGNLHMTLLLPTATPIRDQPKLSFVAGVALARAVKALLPSAEVAMKWPNDLLLNGGKASGLLLEGLGQGAAVAIGIGVNIVAHPPETPYPAAHLQHVDPTVSREKLFTALSVAMVDELDSFADGRGFPLIRQRWLARAAHLGEMIRVRQGDGHIEGIFRDLDADGRLLLETSGGLARIEAGDVFPLDK